MSFDFLDRQPTDPPDVDSLEASLSRMQELINNRELLVCMPVLCCNYIQDSHQLVILAVTMNCSPFLYMYLYNCLQISIGGEIFIATRDSFEFVTPIPAPEPISTTTVIIIAVCGAVGLLFFVIILTIVLCCCAQGYNKSSRKSSKGKERMDIPLNKVGHVDD